jgi:hypothetical protein
MDEELWHFWLLKMNLSVKSESEKKKSLSYPDRGFKRAEELQCVEWSSNLPALISPTWWRTKWVSLDTGLTSEFD